MSLPHAANFRELIVYRRARDLQASIFEASKDFPKNEVYSLTDQIRRSSRSVGAQIAEAWAKRRYEKHFISKLTDAIGELNETEHWLESARECGYITETDFGDLLGLATEIGKMLSSMIHKSGKFCSTKSIRVKESDLSDFLLPADARPSQHTTHY